MNNIKFWGKLNKEIDKDKGFTLVELIVCVGILVIATIPIAQSFARAQRVNAKAQSMQNATSLAESVMEEIKGTKMPDLMARYPSECTYDAPSDSYTLSRSSVASQQGERFDVVANIVTATYKTSDGDGDGFDDEKPTAEDANSVRLPSIEEIDTTYMTAISSKEINKYDQAAIDYFVEYSAGQTPTASIAEKYIDIIKKDDHGAGGEDIVNVICNVTYISSEDDPHSKNPETGVYEEKLKYTREVYSGSYVANASGEVPNNIYIFYRRCLSSNEFINVEDTSSMGSHKVYLVMQDGVTDISGTSVSIASGAGTIINVNSNSDLGTTGPKQNDKQKGRVKSGDYELITNLDTVGTEGNIFEEKQRNHVYEVTVKLTKPGETEVIASLTSTKNVTPK